MKALELLRSLSKKDWHWLGKLLNSPIYNQNESLIRLFNYFRSKKELSKKDNTSKNISAVLFPEAAFDAAKVHHAGNYLSRNIEAYFAWDEWWQDEEVRQRYLLQAYRKRNLDSYFLDLIQRLREDAGEQPLRHAEHYRSLYRLALEEYQYSMQIGRSTAEQLQPLSDWHDLAFIAEKLKNACGIVSRQRVLRTDLEMGLLTPVLDYVRANPALLEHPSIAVYFHGYLALTEPDQEHHFFALKNQLGKAVTQFPIDELRDVYLLAINFCIHRINLREEIYLSEVFDLYKNGLNSGVFLDYGQISRFTYTNIALAGLRLKAYAWVYDFLFQYREKLPETQRQGVFSFNLARYFCERGDFVQAMPLLQEMDFDDVLHNLTAKAMLAKMYYETEELTALDSLLASLTAYLRRKRQVSEQQRNAYKNFIRFTRRLSAAPKRDRKKRKALLGEIQDTALVAEKDWLLRMAGEG